jgi:hypothetical protein
MQRQAYTAQQIVEGLSEKVREGATSISTVASEYSERIYERPLKFHVGEYIVKVRARGDKKAPDLSLSCNCKGWVFQGSEYHAKKNKYLLGKAKGTATAPSQRDPRGENRLCKHAYAVLRDFFGA